jgi:hypothetical protein
MQPHQISRLEWEAADFQKSAINPKSYRGSSTPVGAAEAPIVADVDPGPAGVGLGEDLHRRVIALEPPCHQSMPSQRDGTLDRHSPPNKTALGDTANRTRTVAVLVDQASTI